MLLFQPRFARLVESGKKRQTIRPRRKSNPIVAGDELSLREWTGIPYHSPQRLIVPGPVTCTSMQQITLDEAKGQDDPVFFPMQLIATADGFDSWEDMMRYFKEKHGLPFTGDLIKW